MRIKIGFLALNLKSRLQKAGLRCLPILLYVIIALLPNYAIAQGTSGTGAVTEGPDYEEISIFFSMPRVGGSDVGAIIRDEVLYLPVTEVFNFLKIKNIYTAGFDEITGFIVNEDAKYLIDRVNNKITYKQKVYQLHSGDLIRTETNLYLRSNYFGEIFELQCVFNFRALTVTLNSKIELPIIREMRLEQMRKNMSVLKGDIKADTTIKRNYPFFKLGNADWSAVSNQEIKGETNTRLSLSLGSVIAGGEANANINYTNTMPFEERQQYYSWRYVNNDFKPLRQVTLGKLNTEATSTLNSPIIGAQITNSPTTYRGSFGSYTISDFTEPNWTVELYVNNVLIDFKKADASGFYKFVVPLVYGNTTVKLMFYGPFGEERSKEQEINIPYNFLPQGTLEYKITGGFVDDSLYSKFSRANVDFGVTRFWTIGGGAEYLSSVSSGNFMPFLSTSFRIGSKLLLAGEYTHKVKATGIMNLRLFKEVQLEMNYTKYDPNQEAINNNYLEERKAALSIPIQGKHFNIFTRMSFNQIVLPLTKSTTAEFLLSGSLYGVNTNLTTSALFTSVTDPIYYSNLSLSFRLPGSFLLSPQTRFDYNIMQFVSAKAVIEKRIIKKGFMSLSYERNFANNYTNIEVGMRLDLSFAQVSATARKSNDKYTFTETASGSFMYDAKTKYLSASNRSSVGKGGITMFAFLDMNGNGKYDKHEPKAYGLQLHINGGRVQSRDRDTTVRVFELEPYTNYLVTLDGTNFDNIAWQIKHKSFSVAVGPNQFRTIEIPISVMGEAAGTVYFGSGSSLKGQGRVLVNFYRSDNSLAAQIMTESDGYFSYLGLKPGKYTAKIDPAQMEKINMSATPAAIPLEIHSGTEGDVVDGLEFIIRSNVPEPAPDSVPVPAVAVPAKTDTVKTQKVPQARPPQASAIASATKGTTLYRVQIMALRKQIDIRQYFSKLLYDIPGLIIEEKLGADGLYHYSTGSCNDWVKAVRLQKTIRQKGWTDSFVAIYVGEERADSCSGLVVPERGVSYYRVQLIALAYPVAEREFFRKLLQKMPELKIVESRTEEGLYRYSTELFRSVDQAREYLRAIKQNGWEDCYIAIDKY